MLELVHDVVGHWDEVPLERGPQLIVTLAPWQLWLASQNADYYRTVAAAEKTTIDGKWLAQLLALARRPHAVLTGRGVAEIVYAGGTEVPSGIAVLGGSDAAIDFLRTHRPSWQIFGGRFGVDVDLERLEEIVHIIRVTGVSLVLLALGSPKQEAWGRRVADSAGVTCFGVGGALETVTGIKRPPSLIAQRLRMEWLQRTFQDPRRFVPRVAQAFSILPRLAVEAVGARFGRVSAS